MRAWIRSFGLQATLSNCSNNYGPYQHVEKFIPRQITGIIQGVRPKLYGAGANVRDWIHVEDHCKAVETVLKSGRPGEIYNVSSGDEKDNMEIVRTILKSIGKDDSSLEFVEDRPGHDRRYAIDSSRIQKELGWKPTFEFEEAIGATIDWYLENKKWWERIISGEYQKYFDVQYSNRHITK